jgi:ABC-type branched-subunit amino acid transport system substrate-binding protein
MLSPGQEQRLSAIVAAELSRRRFLAFASKAGIGAATATVLSGALGGCDSSSSTGSDTTTSAPINPDAKPIKIGVVTPQSGQGKFIGDITKASIDAALAAIDTEMGGALMGYRPEIVYADGGSLAEEGKAAFDQLRSDPDIVGILWAGSRGLVDSLAVIASERIPVISVFTDLQTILLRDGRDLTDPQVVSVAAPTCFQKSLPDVFGLSRMLDYAKEDRKYDTVALLANSSLYSGIRSSFDTLTSEKGINVSFAEEYTSDSGSVDFRGPLGRISEAGCDALFLYAFSSDTGQMARIVNELGGKYVDTATAIAEKFKPQIFGNPAGTGDATFAAGAGEAASRGTMCAWYLGGLIAQPNFPIRDWIAKYQPKYNGGVVKGGEDNPADCMAALVQAAALAGSTDREKITEALASGEEFKFASPVGFSWSEGSRLALTTDDIVLISLQWEDPALPFNLGTEWDTVFSDGYRGPVHLVDFTLEANRRNPRNKEALDAILAARQGLSCTSDYQGGDQTKIDACKAIN